jgi:hypothetical protein
MPRQSYSRRRIESLQKDKNKIDPLIHIGDEIKAACDVFNKHRGIESGQLTKLKEKERRRISIVFEARNVPNPRKVYVRKQQDSSNEAYYSWILIKMNSPKAQQNLIDKGEDAPHQGNLLTTLEG